MFDFLLLISLPDPSGLPFCRGLKVVVDVEVLDGATHPVVVYTVVVKCIVVDSVVKLTAFVGIFL